jgi:nickel/cobalt exporter
VAFLWAALSVAVFHTLLPPHWLPYVAAAKSNRWTYPRLLLFTLIGTVVHLASTLALTALALLLSYGLSHFAGHVMERIGAYLLILLSMMYFFIPQRLDRWSASMNWVLAVGVGIQPCIEFIPLMLVATAAGTVATMVVGFTWAVTTLVISLALVTAGFWGLPWTWTERTQTYARWVAGILMLVSAILSLMHTH